MKIAFILPSLVNKGPIIVVHNIVKNLKKSVDLIDVYYFDESNSSLNFECDIYQISKTQFIDFDKYDIIHSHTLRSDLYVYKWKNKIKKAKILTTIHQDTFASFSIRYNRFISSIITLYWCYVQRQFDGVVAISNQLKNKYNKLLSGKITTIYNGCDITEAKTQIEIENLIRQYKNHKYKVLGAYATITQGKGLLQIVKVLDLLPDYVFVLIGEGPYLETIKSYVEKFKLSNQVLFIPYIEAPYSYLSLMDVYMMPSYSEGFGLAMVEAALAKKSIVCSNIPSFNEIFNSDEVCFFELDNLNSLRNSIKTAYLERLQRGERANSKVTMFFTAEKMAENHLLYYKKLLKK
ncbi:glycosyltransferase family 4 protein [Flavobacterium anhuiense]|uniref:Glycosyltransferase involved in cell wall bisynthesis n=1 Tax=Flavobacterium anhuiense TaxID=459526 RepID=A0ABY0M3R2_9FLAO|nr:glycosyltransferase family 4 protein [Flavobacterium anhuiense]SCY84913.1 Glycosyltransferase involved in cell wall bisynthesis [Flavobacterium anhuiense]